jgi:hypothetical protein
MDNKIVIEYLSVYRQNSKLAMGNCLKLIPKFTSFVLAGNCPKKERSDR